MSRVGARAARRAQTMLRRHSPERAALPSALICSALFLSLILRVIKYFLYGIERISSGLTETQPNKKS